MAEDDGPAPGAKAGLQGSFVMQKTGPLPNWGWMALGLGAALGYAAWKSSKAKKDAAATGTTGVTAGKAGSANGSEYVFVDADSTVNTLNAAPPGGGRNPHGPDTPPPPSPAPDGQYVTVTKWTRQNPAWSSTLYGIADHLWGAGDSWKAIWNAPENASLKASRKDPTEIEPGDKIWVPNANPGSGSDNKAGHSGNSHGMQGSQQATGRAPQNTTHRNRTRSSS